MSAKRKKVVTTQFHTVKRIDNSRLVRNVEPAMMRNLSRPRDWARRRGVFDDVHLPAFSLHRSEFSARRSEGQQTKSVALNSELRLEIEGLRDPRIDVIARRSLV